MYEMNEKLSYYRMGEYSKGEKKLKCVCSKGVKKLKCVIIMI